jgi:hypothetical protein
VIIFPTFDEIQKSKTSALMYFKLEKNINEYDCKRGRYQKYTLTGSDNKIKSSMLSEDAMSKVFKWQNGMR